VIQDLIITKDTMDWSSIDLIRLKSLRCWIHENCRYKYCFHSGFLWLFQMWFTKHTNGITHYSNIQNLLLKWRPQCIFFLRSGIQFVAFLEERPFINLTKVLYILERYSMCICTWSFDSTPLLSDFGSAYFNQNSSTSAI
jgi:hypothetical protein